MYYSHPCTYCRKVFFTYHSSRWAAAQILYEGIKKHLIEWKEDHREYEMDERPQDELKQMYAAMSEMEEKPTHAYELPE